MSTPSTTRSCSCDFEVRHEQHTHPAMRALERGVLGCDFGGTSWTTKSQADAIPEALGLGHDTRLLEIGAGTGWPGLYMSSLSNCDVTLLDIPINALRHANRRAADEKLEHLSRAVSASGSSLPFADASFDAIGHSDVLCCLPDKLEMLKECRRVVPTGAKMLFYVIAPSRGLTGENLDEACLVGPPFVGVPDDYIELLHASDWEILERTDLTGEYLRALNRLIDGLKAGKDELQTVMGTEEYADHFMRRGLQVNAIERGLLQREVYLARAV